MPNPTANQNPLEVGDFIAIPAWKICGCVLKITPNHLGSEQSVRVLLQERPDDDNGRWYRLEPSQFEVL